MSKIISLNSLDKELQAVKKKKQSIVLVGGCFDILHIGHIRFLKEAKSQGNVLFILLENDDKVTNLKGKNRPFFSQSERAEMLASLSDTGKIILLPFLKTDEDYLHLVKQIKPEIIAVTENDPYLDQKRSQAEAAGSILTVIPYIKTYSSSKLAKTIGIE